MTAFLTSNVEDLLACLKPLSGVARNGFVFMNQSQGKWRFMVQDGVTTLSSVVRGECHAPFSIRANALYDILSASLKSEAVTISEREGGLVRFKVGGFRSSVRQSEDPLVDQLVSIHEGCMATDPRALVPAGDLLRGLRIAMAACQNDRAASAIAIRIEAGGLVDVCGISKVSGSSKKIANVEVFGESEVITLAPSDVSTVLEALKPAAEDPESRVEIRLSRKVASVVSFALGDVNLTVRQIQSPPTLQALERLLWSRIPSTCVVNGRLSSFLGTCEGLLQQRTGVLSAFVLRAQEGSEDECCAALITPHEELASVEVDGRIVEGRPDAASAYNPQFLRDLLGSIKDSAALDNLHWQEAREGGAKVFLGDADRFESERLVLMAVRI